MRGELIHQSIRERIAEGHAEFQHIHAGLVERERELARGFERRVPGPDIDDEAFLFRGLQLREPCVDAIHWGRRVAKQTPNSKHPNPQNSKFAIPIRSGASKWPEVLDFGS